MNFGAGARSYNSHLSDMKPTNVDVDWAANQETEIRALTSDLRKQVALLVRVTPLLEFLNKKISDIDGYERLLSEIKGALSELKASSPDDEFFDRKLSASKLSAVKKKVPELEVAVSSFVDNEWEAWYSQNLQPLTLDEGTFRTIHSVYGLSEEIKELEKINNTFLELSDSQIALKTDLSSIKGLHQRFETLHDQHKITMSPELDALLKDIRSPYTTAKLSDLTPELLDELQALEWDKQFQIVSVSAQVKKK